MTLIAGSCSARPTAASTSSGIGGTMVFKSSGRLRVMVATGASVVYSRVWKLGMPAPIASAGERGDGFGDRRPARDEVEAPARGARLVEDGDENRRDVFAGDAATSRRLGDRHAARAGVVGQHARSDDGPFQSGSAPNRLVSSSFRAQIRLKHLVVGGGLGIGGHRGD